MLPFRQPPKRWGAGVKVFVTDFVPYEGKLSLGRAEWRVPERALPSLIKLQKLGVVLRDDTKMWGCLNFVTTDGRRLKRIFVDKKLPWTSDLIREGSDLILNARSYGLC